MIEFDGFPESKERQVPIPNTFFRHLLPDIDHLTELKLTLYFFWKFERSEGVFRFIRRSEIIEDRWFLNSLVTDPNQTISVLDDALKRALKRGSVLSAIIEIQGVQEECYFLNSPKGRAAIRAIQSGQWQPNAAAQGNIFDERPNIFRLYEENIGPLTPLIAESLAEAQDQFPSGWIEEAIQIAVEKNKRNWRYALAILDRWEREGKHGRKEKSEDREDSPEARRRYIQGEFSNHIEH